ncbi:hypothetical protein T4A_9899 [Trichinella pseudospiralis]|uniref:Uncharacterized protein n=1 Tax=Trichinella pseudospiralis TaxID=6337 RepID=A0A0V1E319_TRIPS|nr:hypothetical protein T4A_9899 [Trichinella pseudospiralis]
MHAHVRTGEVVSSTAVTRSGGVLVTIVAVGRKPLNTGTIVGKMLRELYTMMQLYSMFRSSIVRCVDFVDLRRL